MAINYGSTGKIAEQVGSLVMQWGWDSYIAHGRYINASKSKAIKVGGILDWFFHALMTRLTDKHGLFSRLATKRLIRKIQKISPDIIHLHNIHGYYINYKILFEYL
ncbi:MAG: glycosyl transferase, partial [Alistipes sp.]|nr:glycosyl transferase [Alistipes sp.]